MSKQILVRVGLIFLLLILTVAAGYYIFFVRLGAPRLDIRGFRGSIIAIKGDTIMLRGVFSLSGTIPENLVSERDFSFKVGKDTGFKKADIRWPTWEELAKQGTSGTFNIQDLPRTEGDSSFDDLNDLFLLNPGRSVYVEADFLASIYNSRNPVASSVFYQIIGIPSSPSLLQD